MKRAIHLLLAAVVDVRRSATLKSYQLALPIMAAIAGEIAALSQVAFGDAGPKNVAALENEFAATTASLVSTSIALLMAVLADSAISNALGREDFDD